MGEGNDTSGYEDSESYDGRGERDRRRPRRSARDKIVDYLARRDHSELELERTLSRDYPAEDVSDAIEFARQNGWLKAPEELARQVAEQLHRKNKGTRYIQQFLHSRGLPRVARDVDDEVRKGRELVLNKLGCEPPFEFDIQVKIRRLLANRGFDDDTIRKVIHEKP
jgi:regulatory protein